jgi:predicted enzyme related to lactoylglutathione lyase
MAVSSIVLYALNLSETAEFYRSIGIELDENEQRAVGEAGLVRIVIIRAASADVAPTGSVGTAMIGIDVWNLEGLVERLQADGRRVLRPAQQLDWGRRAVVADPDGRPVELVEHIGP